MRTYIKESDWKEWSIQGEMNYRLHEMLEFVGDFKRDKLDVKKTVEGVNKILEALIPKEMSEAKEAIEVTTALGARIDYIEDRMEGQSDRLNRVERDISKFRAGVK